MIKTVLIFLLCFGSLSAQDVIIDMNQDTIDCVVTDKTNWTIYYYPLRLGDDFILSIPKRKIQEIHLASGEVVDLSGSEMESDLEALYDNRLNTIKASLSGPLMGVFSLAYERSLNISHSYELEVGYIYGTEFLSEKGVLLRVGYKLIQPPNFYFEHDKYAHILKGWYLKPELVFGTYSVDERRYLNYLGTSIAPEPFKTKAYNGALLINAGYQVVFGDSFVLDGFGGLGFAINYVDSYDQKHYSFFQNRDSFWAWNVGLKLGLLF